MTTKKFIVYSTIAMVFGEALRFHDSNALQFFYVVMCVNIGLMLLIKRVWLPMGIVVLAAFLAFSGAVGIVRDTDTITRVAKEWIGIVVEAFYFCCFFKFIDFDLEGAFRIYARLAYYVAIIGLVLYPIEYALFGIPRLKSVMTEPAVMAFTCLPALYFFADQWQRKRQYGKELIVMMLALVLAQSSTGFTGIMFGVILFLTRYRRVVFITPLIVLVLGYSTYFLSSAFALRFTDTYNTFTSADVSGANLSTYVLYTNMFVMEHVLEEHPIMGNGLGSHGKSFQTYIGEMPPNAFNGNDAEDANSEDASSLGTRVLSDMGLLGAGLVLWFIWHCRYMGDSELSAMSKSIWIYFFIKLMRGGTYFDNEMYFFICFYALTHTAVSWRERKAALLTRRIALTPVGPEQLSPSATA